MAGRLTLWGAGEMIRTYFSRTAEPPESYWLALIKGTAPTLYVSGSELDEPDADDYGRVAIPNDYMHWDNSSQPQLTMNILDVAYVTATSDWGIISYWALCNADIDGFCYFVGDLEEPVNIVAGDSVIIGAGDLNVSLGPFYMAEED